MREVAMFARSLALLALVAFTSACGGGASPTSPSPGPGPGTPPITPPLVTTAMVSYTPAVLCRSAGTEFSEFCDRQGQPVRAFYSGGQITTLVGPAEGPLTGTLTLPVAGRCEKPRVTDPWLCLPQGTICGLAGEHTVNPTTVTVVCQ